MSEQPDFTNELAHLLFFAGELGIAINRYFSNKYLNILRTEMPSWTAQDGVDVTLLSDCLAQFCSLTNYIEIAKESGYGSLVRSCEETIKILNSNLKVNDLCDYERALSALNSIILKCESLPRDVL